MPELDADFVLEVEELTSMLRDEEDFYLVREFVIARGHSVGESLMGGLIEGEDGRAAGVVISPQGLEVCIFDAPGSEGYWALKDSHWQIMTPEEAGRHSGLFPALDVAIRLASEPEVC